MDSQGPRVRESIVKGKQTQFLARGASTTKYNGDYGTNNAKENIETQRWQQGTLYFS